MDPISTPQYKQGRAWAKDNQALLVERYSNADLATAELRTYLFDRALRAYPSGPGDMENELRQTLWVLGAIRHVIDTLPLTKEAMRAVFDISMELGAVLGAEIGKLQCFNELKKKPAAWWGKTFKDARPVDILAALEVDWRRRFGREKGKSKSDSPWEVMVDVFGSREMCILAHLRTIELRQDGAYWSYVASSKDGNSFQMLMRPVYHDGRLTSLPGEIVG